MAVIDSSRGKGRDSDAGRGFHDGRLRRRRERLAAARISRRADRAENVVIVKREQIVVGPVISGELRLEREATVRAELGGSMLQVSAGEGEAVRKGALLGRIESNALEDMQRSASWAVRAAENQLAVAQREAERTAQLVSAGALAARDLDIAKANVTNAEAQLADARSRLVSAQKELGDAVLRAPTPSSGRSADRALTGATSTGIRESPVTGPRRRGDAEAQRTRLEYAFDLRVSASLRSRGSRII